MRRSSSVRSFRCSRVGSLLSFLLLNAAVVSLQAQSAASPPSSIQPQIVRLSAVEGDVRITRGDEGKKVSGADWQKAAVDTPLEGGFSVVTGGDGRAEVEFEDTSVAYLAPNSVLVFDQLAARGDLTFSRMQLLSGTLTLRLRPRHPKELYILVTPQDTLTWDYPHVAYVRVNSFLDATVLTPLDKGLQLRRSSGQVETLDGGSLYLRDSQNTPKLSAASGEKLRNDEWDAWVSGRLATRDQAMTAMMHEAGIEEPIPGLADLAGRGRFFDCAPYGRCWEPTGGWNAASSTDTALFKPPSRSAWSQRPHLVEAAFVGQTSGIVPPPDYYDDEYFPCSPYRVRFRYRMDPLTNRRVLLGSGGQFSPFPYDWSLCHAGSWIRHNHHYVWVAGTHHHHHCPVHWVSNGGHKGYVPLHPQDVPGKDPLNLKYGLYETKGWKQGEVEHVAYSPDKSVKVLQAPPKEFLALPMPRLAAAETPHPTAHALLAMDEAKGANVHGDLRAVNKAGQAGPPRSAEIRFDHRSQSFSLAHQEMHDGRTRTVSTPFAGANRGVGVSTASRGGSYSAAGGGVRGGAASSVASHGGGSSGAVASASHSSSSGGSGSSGGHR